MRKRVQMAFGSIALMIGLSIATPANASTTFWQCAPFARMFSGIQLFGRAASWWEQATGKYSRGDQPKAGAVLVFKAAGAMRSGHVATVSQIVSDRIIKVTHANWSSRGQVEHDVEVMDVSAKNDWSKVRVWFKSLHDLGTGAYPAYGFIYDKKPAASDDSATTAASSIAALDSRS